MKELKKYAKSIRRRKYNIKKYYNSEMFNYFDTLKYVQERDEEEIARLAPWQRIFLLIVTHLVELPYTATYFFIEVVVDFILGNATFKKDVENISSISKVSSLEKRKDMCLRNLEGTNVTADYLDLI